MDYRFDLGSKFYYVKCVDKEVQCDYYKELYHKSIESFNGCWEYPGTKTCIEDFFKAFNELIESIKKNGFDNTKPVLIGKNEIMVDGAHRFVISRYHKIVSVIVLKDMPEYIYDYKFFINRVGKPQLSIEYADFMALQYLEMYKVTNNVRSIVIYPVATRYKIFP